MNLWILDFRPSIVNTGESGATPPSNASCPKDSHMCIVAVLMKERDMNVRPQSSYLNLGFCGIVVVSPTERMTFFARFGEMQCTILRVILRHTMKQNIHVVDKYTASFCTTMMATWWRYHRALGFCHY